VLAVVLALVSAIGYGSSDFAAGLASRSAPVIQITRVEEGRFVAIASLFVSAGPILLALLRVVPNAIKLGASSGNAIQQSALARSICRDHLLCFIGIAAFVGMQLARAAS